ncbi:ornithine carbamoyltransferase [candidate division LCP-89 bacterium B3_LCP]|uniref:Ornithine carbamoyltransferase n=1 Tax=candidate division LCP-89 bacterium B3_LCP TaxID=2012998 RepID=A0A532V3I3_UNCL8|nr:MAG: ornithine carbamoyltransferase [candidate division LCP-89 bacterium B3_LCP]
MKRDFLAITDLTVKEVHDTISLALELKEMRGTDRTPLPLKGRTVGCIFHKASLRTRISFETGIYELGGASLYITKNEIDLGKRESIEDAARALSRYLSMIMIRTFSHDDVEKLAKYADVPVINGLTDFAHPCQVMGDMMTVQERLGVLDGVKVAYLGDGNNLANSWLNAARRVKMELCIGTSEQTYPDMNLFKAAQDEGLSSVSIVHDAIEAVQGAQVVYTDVWASMGQKEQGTQKAELLRSFQINDELLKHADPDCIVLHCLPAERGREITDEVMDGPHSAVFDQAENRLHVQKAIMVRLMEWAS